MKKNKVLSVVFCIVVLAAYHGYKANSNLHLTDLMLSNVEALANDENPPKLYSAVKGTATSNGSLKRTKDEYGKCIYKLLRDVTATGDCTM